MRTMAMLLGLAWLALPVRADGPVVQLDAPPPGFALPAPPDWLPRYDFEVKVADDGRSADVRQTTTWTNTGTAPAHDLVFRVYPRHQPRPKEHFLFERTFEALRTNSREAFDKEGRRATIASATVGGVAAAFSFDAEDDTLMPVALPAPVAPGAAVAATLVWRLDIPELMGRVGRWKGITTLLNWYPVLAVRRDNAWDVQPFRPWHLSFLQDAGRYRGTVELPRGEELATGAAIEQAETLADGRRRYTLRGEGLRDLALVFSRRFDVLEGDEDGVRIRVLALPEHRVQGRTALLTVRERLRDYGKWFGKYPFPQATVAEAYLGWLGNQTGGMALVDVRALATPEVARRYVEHLVSHEFCHQWWYGLIGVDGAREPWMHEGLTSYFTLACFREKYGRGSDLLEWPCALRWLGNIPYETLAHSGYLGYAQRGGKGKSLAPLDEIGHLNNLLYLVYDRGARVAGMVHHRLGDERFFAFLRTLMAKRAYQVVPAAEFQADLAAFDAGGGHDWPKFFADWLSSPATCDWQLQDVSRGVAPDGRPTATLRVRQRAQLREPLDIAIHADGKVAKKFLFDPAGPAPEGVAVRNIGPETWELETPLAAPAERVELDPDEWLLDNNLGNNSWRRPLARRFTLLHTPVDESSMVRPLDRPSLVWGPSVDIDGRWGVRASFVDGDRWRVSPFVAYQAFRQLWTGGVDGEWFNAVVPNVSVGLRYERTLETNLYDFPLNQGKAFVRWYQAYTASVMYPHLSYLEGYFRFGDNFFPANEGIRRPPPGAEDYRDIRAFGATYHLDTRFPYWNPEKGFAFDANAEVGTRLGGAGENYRRAQAQLAAVHRLPDAWGPLSELRVAGRLAGGVGSPDNGLHFRFGGAGGFRGQRGEDTRGSAFWLASGELRFPLLARIDLPLADNSVQWQSLWGSVFYDVGDMWLQRQALGVDHTVGLGLYFQVGVLSFVERFGFRVEYGHSLERGSNMVWLGLFRAF